MTTVEQIPAFAGGIWERVEAVMHWVHGTVQRNLTTDDWIRKTFLRRSIREVLSDGFTLSHNPCVDRTLLTTAILGLNQIDAFIILHESPNRNWHLAMELPLEDGSWAFADYGTRESRLMTGRYRFGLVPGKRHRLVRLKRPRYGESIWDARPPLRFLRGMGVDLLRRFDKFESDREMYEQEVESDTYSVDDVLVSDPRNSVYWPWWRDYPMVEPGDPGLETIDFSHVSLYLDHGARR